LESATTESLEARFNCWPRRRFLDLRARSSDQIQIYNGTAGFVDRLLEASGTYCVRLDRRTLEKDVMPVAPSALEPQTAQTRISERGSTVDGTRTDTYR